MRWAFALKRGPAVGVVVALVASFLITSIVLAKPASAMTTATQVSAGGLTTCAVMTGGNAYCWGDNSFGQLGNGTTTNSATPVLVPGGYTWASISTQYNSNPGFLTADTCGVTTSGAGYCWGYNNDGQVGDGTTTQRTTPTAISGGYTWAAISAGGESACGVTTTGVGYCWGFNSNGQLGDGNATQSSAPVLVSGGYTWQSISITSRNTCGVTATGVGYCWGYGGTGQNGNGGTSSHNTPTAVSGGYTWSSIFAGEAVVCGVTTTGVGYCWGANGYGSVGDGTTTEDDSPTLVSGGYTWSSISPGRHTTCGITTTGVSFCWGSNAAGEVGDGTTTNRHTPKAVSGGQTFSFIDAGADHATDDTNCGLALDGIVYCWGYDSESQIGDGATTNQDVPTEASLLFTSTLSTTASVTIVPTFTFTVANHSSVCNGESNFASGAGTASTVALGNLAAGANVSGGQALNVVGNSGGGFAVYVAGNQATNDLRSGSHNWADVAGTYASPTVLGAGEQFGYTYHDSTTSSAVTNPPSANFIALTNATTNEVMGSASSTSGSGCVSFDAQTSASTPAASYAATVIYTAVPTF